MNGEIRSVLRRATVFVRDMDRTIHFYSEVFGLKVQWDLDVDMTIAADFPMGKPGRGGAMRLVIMRGSDPLVGMMGFIQAKNPPLDDPPSDNRLNYGNVALVLETSDLASVERTLLKLGGTVLRASRDSRGFGDAQGNIVPARVLFARDLDGHFLEVFQITGT